MTKARIPNSSWRSIMQPRRSRSAYPFTAWRRTFILIPAVVVTALAAAQSASAAMTLTGEAAGAIGASADLATTVWNFGGQGIAGTTTTFSAGVTNDGTSTAQNVTVTEKWTGMSTFYGVATDPAGVSCATPPVGIVGIWAAHVVTCTIPSLASGQSVGIRLVLFVRTIFARYLLVDTATATAANSAPSTASAAIPVI